MSITPKIKLLYQKSMAQHQKSSCYIINPKHNIKNQVLVLCKRSGRVLFVFIVIQYNFG